MPRGLIIVGAGPGGLAPLFAAASGGKLQTLLASGVVVVEKSNGCGAGMLPHYAIQSDSPAEAFLDILRRSHEPALQELLSHPVAERLANLRGDTAPLTLAAELLEIAGKVMCSIVSQSPNGVVLHETEVVSIHRRSGDIWEVKTLHLKTQEERSFLTHSVHLATGAHQPLERLQRELVAGEPLLPRFADKVMQSGELFTTAGTQALLQKLNGKVGVRIAIVGGSTSAGSAAVHLLRRTPIQFAEGGVTILHRSHLRLFYASVEEALDDGYDDFTTDDVCRLSGRVYRLSGFRFESKDLLRNALGIRGRKPDARLKLQYLPENDNAAQALLEQADVIIAAMGYQPRMCPVFDAAGHAIPLHQPRSGDWAMVDQTCHVFTREKNVLPGLTAMGLAIGPAASHEFGGEANFRGQVNSLWLWQNKLGERVANGALNRVASTTIPLMRPSPPSLSEHLRELQAIEESNTYSNFGPVNSRFEQELVNSVFDGEGYCLTACNATLALMIAIRDAIGENRGARRYALMPSFTFAAAAQAAIWCGLTPLYCDIDPRTWLPSHESESRLLQQYADQIAIIVPNATFGNNLDLHWYEQMSDETGIPVVIDAAASLGSLTMDGAAFGKGSLLPIVFSMHATKTFATGEGGIVYSYDRDLIERLRIMESFGFGEPRTATMIGLNAKLSEVAALTALLQLRALPVQAAERQRMSHHYQLALNLPQQHTCGQRQVRSFESVLLPKDLAPMRPQIMASLRENGIITGCYFSPHLAEQPFLRDHSLCPPLPVTDDISSRILALPLFYGITYEKIDYVSNCLLQTIKEFSFELAV